MPGKILTKIARFGYVGQVMTAGILLTVAVLLMFVVIETLEPLAKPPTAKNMQLSEPVEQEQTVLPAAIPDNQALASPPSQLPLHSADSTAVLEVVTAKNKVIVGKQLIAQLWNGKITCDFGWQLHPLYQDWRYHNGIDISGGEGQIVPALADGEILEIYTDKQYGLTVVAKWDKYIISYSSLASVVVQKNQAIQTGTPLGSMGITLSEPETHLHLSVQKQDTKEYYNPRELFPTAF